MAKKLNNQNYFYEISERNALQSTIFIIIFISINIILFAFTLDLLEEFFIRFLNGRVFNKGETIGIVIDLSEPKKTTNYISSWAIDIYLKTPSEARYWFNPIVSLFIPLGFISLILTLIITILIPANIGYLRQKFEREIIKIINQIEHLKHGFSTEISQEKVIQELETSSMKELSELSKILEIPLTELIIIQNALKWRKFNIINKIIKINSALRFYMYYHFTVKYQNTVLGLVYIGAAVLIIIVGLRGLKFIPPTQPSLVLFALGLEFTLLIAYATTLIYSKYEEEEERKTEKEKRLVNGEFGSAKEVESLLKMFIKTKK